MPLCFLGGCVMWHCLFGVAHGFPWSVVGWPRMIERIAGMPLGHVPLASALRVCCLIGCLSRRCAAVAVEGAWSRHRGFNRDWLFV